MVILLVIATISLIALAYILTRAQSNPRATLLEPRGEMLTLAVQIVCGDCSGDEARPIKSYLDRHGRCAHCGGSSYALASRIASYSPIAARSENIFLTRIGDRINTDHPNSVEPLKRLQLDRIDVRTA